jgi:hypothetical protein
VTVTSPGKLVTPAYAAAANAATGSDGALTFTVESEAVASHLWLSTVHPGRFSDNAVTLHPCLPQAFTFYPHRSMQSQLSPDAFTSSLRATSVFDHQYGMASDSDNNGGWVWGGGTGKKGGDTTDGPVEFGLEQPAVGSSRVFVGGGVQGEAHVDS